MILPRYSATIFYKLQASQGRYQISKSKGNKFARSENVFQRGRPKVRNSNFLGFSEASCASFSEASARSCAKQLIVNKWCEALSSISWFWGARRAKIQVPTFHITLRFWNWNLKSIYSALAKVLDLKIRNWNLKSIYIVHLPRYWVIILYKYQASQGWY